MRAAIVTGASRNIGLAIARRLLHDGWNVCLTGRDRDTLQDIIAKLKVKDFGIHMQFTNYRSN